MTREASKPNLNLDPWLAPTFFRKVWVIVYWVIKLVNVIWSAGHNYLANDIIQKSVMCLWFFLAIATCNSIAKSPSVYLNSCRKPEGFCLEIKWISLKTEMKTQRPKWDFHVNQDEISKRLLEGFEVYPNAVSCCWISNLGLSHFWNDCLFGLLFSSTLLFSGVHAEILELPPSFHLPSLQWKLFK